MSGLWKLQWTRRPRVVPPPPEGLQREFIQTDSGIDLELLYAPAQGSNHRQTPLLFLHGGYGCAEAYADYLRYFSARGFHSYSLSIRGHGHSYRPSFLKLVCFTTFHTLVLDACTAIKHVTHAHNTPPVIFGHSSGGGMAQYIVSNNLVPVAAIGLLAPIPGYGGIYVYMNWWKMDPWFSVRCFLRDWGHPSSPLSETRLIRGALFSPDTPQNLVTEFETLMPPWESYMWPFTMMFKFVNFDKIVSHLAVSKLGGGMRILVLAGSKDALMGTRLMGQLADIYRGGRRALLSNKKVEPVQDAVLDDSEDLINRNGGARRGTVDGVRFDVVEGAGHQFMNDYLWEESAKKVYTWLKDITAA